MSSFLRDNVFIVHRVPTAYESQVHNRRGTVGFFNHSQLIKDTRITVWKHRLRDFWFFDSRLFWLYQTIRLFPNYRALDKLLGKFSVLKSGQPAR